MVKSPLFEIIAGSYEEFLLGYNFSSKKNELVQSFAAHDHAASLRCVATSGPYLASGGADDRIFVYDMKTRKEHCALTHHESTITCLQFTENHSHLISGSSDGVLTIVRVGNWQLEKIWPKAHKGAAIHDIAIHASGKLALTLGADCALNTWNLIKGREAYVINLNSKSKDAKSLERIMWAPDGVRFLLYGGQYTEIWSIESGGVLKQIEHPQKVTSCAWLDDSLLLVGYEDGQVSLFNTDGSSVESFKAHDTRVKAISLYEEYIITVSSDGYIKVWNRDFEELASAESGCRLTCLCVVPPVSVKNENSTEEETVEEVKDSPVKKKTVMRSRVIEEFEEEESNEVGKKRTKNFQKQTQEKVSRKKKKKGVK